MPKIKHGNVVLCEYVGQGSGNKPILINVFSGDIIVSRIPADLQFGLFIELAPGQKIEIITIEMVLDAKMVVRAEMLVAAPSRTGSALIIPQVPVRVERDSVFKIRALAKDYFPTIILQKRIFQGHVPGAPTASTESGPPPSQSPPVAS